MERKSKSDVIEAIKSASQSIGTSVLTQKQFFERSDITISDVLRHFAKWSDACQAAGVEHDRSRDRVSDDELLSDWGSVARQVGRVPSLTEYRIKGKFSRKAFDRFGKWIDLPNIFCQFFNNQPEWDDVFSILKQNSSKQITKKVQTEQKTNRSINIGNWQKLNNRQIYGDPIDFRGLRHEPVNEQGVVFLFGMVAHDLGYRVEAIQGGFPDCEAKRRVDRGQWQTVQIEFEYASRHFVDHGHDPNKCDLIVCWKHNWHDCPSNIEVLELSEIIKKL